MSLKIQLLLFLLVGVPAASTGFVAPKGEFEFRGKLLLPDEQPLRNVVPVILLEGSSFPYSSQALAGPGGSFKFGDLTEGLYRLHVVVRGWGEMVTSVDIGPGSADEKGRVEKVVIFRPERNTDGGGTISTSQLHVPDSAWRSLRKVEKKLEKRDTEGAIRELEKLLQKHPHFPAAWNRLGTIAYLSGRYRDAEEYFSKALEDDPEMYAPLVNLAAVQLHLGKLDKALELNRRCTELRPDDPLAWSQLGQTQFVLGTFAEAEENLRRAKEIDPGHSSYPQLVLAEIYRKRQEPLEVARELEEFLALHPDFPQADFLRQLIAASRTSGDTPP